MHRTLLGVSTAVVAGVAAIVVVTASLSHHHHTVQRGSAGPSAASPGTALTFRLSGHIKNMYPGRKAHLRVAVHNLERFPIRMLEITARVVRGGPGCSGRYIRIKTYHGGLRVPSHRWRSALLAVRMLRGAPDACQNVRFSLHFWGKAVTQ